jgi:MYXO-CTERM domain-containing protein
VLTLLGWLGLVLRQVPAAFLILTAAGLGFLYAILRWRIATAYTDRLLAQLEMGPGWWMTVYGMLGLAVVCLVLGIRGRRRD